MKSSNLLAPMTSLVLAAASLNGCSSAGSQFGPPSAATGPATTLATQSRGQEGAHPLGCIPTVWASSLSTNAVYGYVAANSPPCITLNGTYAGLAFNAPTSVAVWKKYLFVADLNNDRVVVFTITGSYVKYFSTALGGNTYQPWGVCVSQNGIVGTGNRSGNVEFWKYSAPSGSTPTGNATGTLLQSYAFCAFDKLNNFYVDGAAFPSQGGGQQIAFLPSGNVNAGTQTLCNSGLGNGGYWVGMYSRINSPVNQTLSVGAAAGNQVTELVYTWPVTGSGTSCSSLAFGAPTTLTLTPYPSTPDPMYQLAPKKSGGPAGPIYVADYGDNTTLRATALGAVSVLQTVPLTTGVAAQPSGQY